jgi:cell wall assembly regulator SMI1
MTEETWRRLEEWRAGWVDCLAGPVPTDEIDAASTALGLPFPPDYREFLRRYGGGMVGRYPIFGLRVPEAMSQCFGRRSQLSAASTVDGENRRYREAQRSGIGDWLIISADVNGSPIGIAPDGYIWVSRGGSEPLLVAEGFEAFLNLCLEPDSGDRWLMIHPAIAAAPVKPELSPILFALSEASRYDIWDTAVLVQTLWSEELEECVLLWPLDEAGLGWCAIRKVEPKPDWRVEIRMPHVRGAVPTVVTSGTLTPLDPASSKAMLANAVLVICKQFAWLNPRGLEAPMIIRASETSEGYGVGFQCLPRVAGGDTLWTLSKDLRRYQLSPGR